MKNCLISSQINKNLIDLRLFCGSYPDTSYAEDSPIMKNRQRADNLNVI